MGASTRASLEAVKTQVASVSEVDSDLVSGLCQAGRAIADHPSLLSALADHSHPVDKRTVLLTSALSQATSAVTSQLASVIGLTWSTPRDLLAGIEEFAIRLAAKGAGKSDLTGELLEVGRVIRRHSDLQLALSDKRAPATGKIAVVEKLFGKKVSPLALALVSHLVVLPRGRRVSDALTDAARIVCDQQGVGLAQIQVASELSATQRTAVETMLSGKYGKEHYLDVVVDEAVIGGMRIRVGDVVIDASVQKQLSDMRLQLAG